MARVIAVDIGASNYRIIEGLYDGENLKLNELARFKQKPVMENGHYHWDIRQIHRNVVEQLQKAAEYGEPILSVGFDTFGADFGLVDKNMQLIENPMCYRDTISVGIKEKYFANERELYPVVGGTFITDTAVTLKGMREIGYEPLERAEHLLMMPDLMTFLMTGKTINESTIASSSRLVDVTKNDWAYDLIRELDIPDKIFHPLTMPGTVIGKLLPEFTEGYERLADTVVAAVACHDTASAYCTIPAIPHCSFLSSGTWSVKGVIIDKPVLDLKAADYDQANVGMPWGQLRLIQNITGLWVLEQCLRCWQEEGLELTAAQLAQEAMDGEPFPAVIHTGAKDFEKFGDMPARIRDYCARTGQAVPEKPVDYMKVIAQGLGCAYRLSNERLNELTGDRIDTVFIVGGGLKNRYLDQISADITGCRIITGHPEAATVGNVLMQLYAKGIVESREAFPEIAASDWPEETYEPKDHDRWESLYGKFLELVS